MTFEIPDEIADRFMSQVPASEQSGLVASLLLRRVSRPKLTEEEWDSVCRAANEDPETQQIEREMAALPNTLSEE